MPEDYYDSEDESSPSEADNKDMDEGEDEQKTFLAPKSAFGGHKCKVGDVYKFKVVHLYDDEVELQYVKGKSEDEDMDENKPERGRMMREAEESMGALAEEEA